MSYYLSQSLTFDSDKITYQNFTGDTREVMMDWEDPIMSASAAYACENGGDILEIGFGMGISCLLYTSPSPRDRQKTRMPSSA